MLPFTPVAPLTLVCSHVLRHQIGMVGTMVRWCPPPYHTDETVKSRCNPEPFQQGMPSLFTYQFQAKPCRCSRWVASIVERIDLGYASNLMRVLIKLTAPIERLLDCNQIPVNLCCSVPKRQLIIIHRLIGFRCVEAHQTRLPHCNVKGDG